MTASGLRHVPATDSLLKGTPRQGLESGLKQASLATAERGRPPVRFRLADRHVELFARESTAWEGADPDGREAMLGCGVFLLHLKIELEQLRCLRRVELFPDLGQPLLAARIHAGHGPRSDPPEWGRFDAMARRRNPSPLGAPPLTDAMLEAFRYGVTRERAWLEFAHSENSRRRLLELLAIGEPHHAEPHLRPQFSVRVEARGPARSALPTEEPIRSRISRWTRPLVALQVRSVASESTGTDPAPGTLAVIKTKTDEKDGWLAAGQAMARINLQAQALGLSGSFSNQAIRNRGVRAALRTGIGRKGFAQAILRIGMDHGTGTPIQPALSHLVTATATMS